MQGHDSVASSFSSTRKLVHGNESFVCETLSDRQHLHDKHGKNQPSDEKAQLRNN